MSNLSTIFNPTVLVKRSTRSVESMTTTIRELYARVVEFDHGTTNGQTEPLNPRPEWQRNYICKEDRYQAFITAIWEKNPINPIIIARMPGETVDAIFDGLQRYGMIEQYLKSEEFRNLPVDVRNEFYKTKITTINLGPNWFETEKEAANYFIGLNKGTTVLTKEQMRRMIHRDNACYKYLVNDINKKDEWREFFKKMVRNKPESLSDMTDERLLFLYLGCYVHGTPANIETTKGWFETLSADPNWLTVLNDFYKHLVLLTRIHEEVIGKKVSKSRATKFLRVMLSCAKDAPSLILFQEQSKVFCQLNGKKANPGDYVKLYNLDLNVIGSLYGSAGEMAIVRAIKEKMGVTKRSVKWREKLPFNNICAITGEKIEKSNAEVDHILPLSKGGQDVLENVQWVSKYANRVKGNNTETAK